MRTGQDRGFTLIELIFVLLVMALLGSVAIPKTTAILGMNLKSGATRVGGYLQRGYERSVMRHQRLRIRFDLEKNRYWAEEYREPEMIPLIDADSKLEEVEELFEKKLEEADLTDEEKQEKMMETFQVVDEKNLQPTLLPSGIQFRGVYLSTVGKVVNQGVPWIDLFPSGFNPKAIVYVTNRSGTVYSIIFPPLTGRVRIEKGEVFPENA